ncbi:MAG: type II 3-dehydroquinate dehydratase [Alphaproteobacteria bacterium]|nr:type II 3-dehydroquinate dehydratase [Alphaproteobacteria bacterium]
MLGVREPTIYGKETLQDLMTMAARRATELGFLTDARQSNHEGDLITWIHQARGEHHGIIINPAGYTHTSIAILDALQVSELPVIEIHLSNIHKREEFRHHSYVSKVARGVICGFGGYGYVMAVDAMARFLKE